MRIFNDEDDNSGLSPVAGSHSLVGITNTLTLITTTTQQQQQLLGWLWPLLVSRFLFRLPPQLRSLLLGLPVLFLGVLFTQEGKQPVFLPKELGLNPPKRPQKVRARKAVAKVVRIKEGGRGVKNLLLLLLSGSTTLTMIQMLGIPSLLSPLLESLVSTLRFQTSEINW